MLLSENQKIGTTLLFLGVLFLCFGVVLFSSFFLSLGNVMFLIGLLLTMGLSRSIRFFRRKLETNAVRGVCCFLGGVFLVLVLRWSKIGIVVEAFGFVNLFGNFFPIALQAMRQMPYLGDFLATPGISSLADKLAGVENRKSRSARDNPNNWA